MSYSLNNNIVNNIIPFVIQQILSLIKQCELVLSYKHDKVTLSYLYALHAVAKTALTLALQEDISKIILQKTEKLSDHECNKILSRQEFLICQDNLQKNVEIIMDKMIKWYQNVKDSKLTYSINQAGYTLLKILVNRYCRRKIINTKVAQKSKQLHLHYDIMQRSFEKAMLMGGSLQDQARYALKLALVMKSTLFNMAPELVIVHDLDNNLTLDESYYSDFPNWNLFLKAKEVHDKYQISPWEARFSALSIFGNQHLDTRKNFLLLLKDLGCKISHLVFEDVKELSQKLSFFSSQEGGIECCIVTGNNSIVANEVSERLGWLPARVWGVNESNCDGFDKALTLLEIFCDKPNIILICSDDGDTGLIQDMKKESLLPSKNIKLPLSRLSFFAARCATEDESSQYRLSQELNFQKIPFLSNYANKTLSGKIYGYQGVTEYVKIYREYIVKRQSY